MAENGKGKRGLVVWGKAGYQNGLASEMKTKGWRERHTHREPWGFGSATGHEKMFAWTNEHCFVLKG